MNDMMGGSTINGLMIIIYIYIYIGGEDKL